MNFKTGHFVLRYEENIVEFVKRRFRNQKLSLSTKTKLNILLNFPFVFVSFNPETRNFGLKNHRMV